MPPRPTPAPDRPYSTRNQSFLHILSLLIFPILALNLTGCAAPESTRTSTGTSSTIAAMVNGQPVTNNELWPIMAEISGQQALEERILTRYLDEIARDSDWVITDADLQLELDALITTIDQSSDRENTPRLIETIRRRRGLGPTRFNALLRRNTILRRLLPPTENAEFQGLITAEVGLATAMLPENPTHDRLTEIIRRSTLVVQQREMEKLARSLLEGREVLVMDRSLKWSGE